MNSAHRWLGSLSLVSVLIACGDTDKGPQDGGTDDFTFGEGVDTTDSVGDLSDEAFSDACEQVQSYIDAQVAQADRIRIACTLTAVVEAGSSQACESQASQCQADGGRALCDASRSRDACTVSLAAIEACIDAHVGRLRGLDASLSCDLAGNTEALAALAQSAPVACRTVYEQCADLLVEDLSGGAGVDVGDAPLDAGLDVDDDALADVGSDVSDLREELIADAADAIEMADTPDAGDVGDGAPDLPVDDGASDLADTDVANDSASDTAADPDTSADPDSAADPDLMADAEICPELDCGDMGITVTSDAPGPVAPGTEVTLTANVDGDPNDYDFDWWGGPACFVDRIPLGSGQQLAVVPFANATYHVVVSMTGGEPLCTAEITVEVVEPSFVARVVSEPFYPTETITVGDDVTFWLMALDFDSENPELSKYVALTCLPSSDGGTYEYEEISRIDWTINDQDGVFAGPFTTVFETPPTCPACCAGATCEGGISGAPNDPLTACADDADFRAISFCEPDGPTNPCSYTIPPEIISNPGFAESASVTVSITDGDRTGSGLYGLLIQPPPE